MLALADRLEIEPWFPGFLTRGQAARKIRELETELYRRPSVKKLTTALGPPALNVAGGTVEYK
jgi:hypothetical protein